MKHQYYGILLTLLGIPILFGSCSNDIDLITPGDPVPVIWCLLNPGMTEQYVRLGRSYLDDPNHPGEAPLTDSTVWDVPVIVYMEEVENGLTLQTIRFEPAEAPAKDTGFFPSDNLRLYKADFQPKRLMTYRLYVHFPDDDRIVTGYTTIPGQPVIYDPEEIPGRTLNLQSGVQYMLRWAPAKGAGIYQGIFRVSYTEMVDGEESVREARVRTTPLLNFTDAIRIEMPVSGVHFLDELGRIIPVKPGAVREITGLQFQMYSGGLELALQTSPDLQTTTISGSLNQYTNLSHGIGLFSSIQTLTVNNLELSRTTLNDIARSENTKMLGFKDVHGGPPE